jgi:hypothetical protein
VNRRLVWWHGFSVGVWLSATLAWLVVMLFGLGVLAHP